MSGYGMFLWRRPCGRRKPFSPLVAPHDALVVKLAVEQEACIVTVTHDEKIFDRFDRLIHLRDGRLADA